MAYSVCLPKIVTFIRSNGDTDTPAYIYHFMHAMACLHDVLDVLQSSYTEKGLRLKENKKNESQEQKKRNLFENVYD